MLFVSRCDIHTLIAELQYVWDLDMPKQESGENNTIIETFPFTYRENNKYQRIERVDKEYLGERNKSFILTNFYFDDQNLFQRIINNLPYKGFEQKKNQNGKNIYKDGNNLISITKTPDASGVYTVTVVIGNRNIINMERDNNSSKSYKKEEQEVGRGKLIQKIPDPNNIKYNSFREYLTDLPIDEIAKQLKEYKNIKVYLGDHTLSASPKENGCQAVYARKLENGLIEISFSWECD